MRRGLRLAMLVLTALVIGSFAFAALRDEDSRNRIAAVLDSGPTLPAAIFADAASSGDAVIPQLPIVRDE